jgi:hypothetical protein
MYNGQAGAEQIGTQSCGDVLALPGRQEMRLHRLLAGRSKRLRGVQGNRASVAVAPMNPERTGKILKFRKRGKA